ncbi:hypothetical protein L198_08194 [Cryptococcus wingfieldii CBS 7118]|uniref:Myo-inositol 2-dehydrogenase n=1 Tax=Cryptococcus wingfieldii CBS 7118 TaxID=1295528 RepID=A0A1E3HF06_9TREE|nr:hypothetical protein L198_08194 [Cryptococcus wingfieldii CBS 7118]ODN74943.1 hypothetical protein L198_08194 [Cryptococcus wingfieldii CBS 7118]
MSAPSSPKLPVAILGCGRMGQRHAHNFHHLTPRAAIVAIGHPSALAAQWVQDHLPGVLCYADPEQVSSLPNVDAVVISTITSTHTPFTMKAIEHGLHVLLEKPISVDVEDTRPVVDAASSKPEVKVMIGFVRRFDQALNGLAGELVGSKLGKSYLLKSTSMDPYDPVLESLYLMPRPLAASLWTAGGIHDIDMSRWLLSLPSGTPVKPTRVIASGLITAHPELADQGYCDNALAIIEYDNGSFCTLHLSRTGMAGYESRVEAYRKGGKQVITMEKEAAGAPFKSVEAGTADMPSYMDRYGVALIHEAKAFIDCVLDDTPSPTSAYDGLQAALIAKALTHSFQTGKAVEFDRAGEPVLL